MKCKLCGINSIGHTTGLCPLCRQRKDINDQLDNLIDKINRGEMNMKMKCEESIEIEEKRHEGEILRVEEKTDPYHYIDIVVSCDGLKKNDGNYITLKLGFPAYFSPTSGLGKFFALVTEKQVKAGKEYNLDDMIGKKLSYTTTNKKTEKGKFARINVDSIDIL